MSTPEPVPADAVGPLSEDVHTHLQEAEDLADADREWSTDDQQGARQLINDLVLVIRAVLIQHRLQPRNDCRICASAWPCPVVSTIHGVVKDPQRQFVALAPRSRDD